MRGGFRRGRFDKVPQPGAVNSYLEALYPPRVYHYYTQQSSAAPSLAAVIVPSIDDGVGDLRGREALPHGVGPVMDKKTPPLLREFVGCFVDGNQYIANSRAFAVLDSGKEPLNVLHYPNLLGIGRKDENAGPSTADKNATRISTPGDHEMRHWEDSLGLPAELRIYGLAKSSCEMPTAAVDRLRIRSSKRKRIVKPIRRGTKVVVLSLAGAEDAPEIKKLKRVVAEEEEIEGGKAQPKRENDDRDEEGSAGYDKEDDEASLSLQVDDDDDGGDLDGPEGSGGEDDFF